MGWIAYSASPKPSKQALEQLGIVTIFDLVSSETFAIANSISDASIGAMKSFARYDQLPGEIVVNASKTTALADLPTKSPDVLCHIGPTSRQTLEKALDIKTIRDLALWPPYHTARAILSEAYGLESVPDGVLEMSRDLILENRDYPTERVHYEVLLFDQFVGENISDDT